MKELVCVKLKSGSHIEKGVAMYLDDSHIEVLLPDSYKSLTKLETSNSTFTDGKKCWKLKEL